MTDCECFVVNENITEFFEIKKIQVVLVRRSNFWITLCLQFSNALPEILE